MLDPDRRFIVYSLLIPSRPLSRLSFRAVCFPDCRGWSWLHHRSVYYLVIELVCLSVAAIMWQAARSSPATLT
jgi:hypothetical protein